MMGTGEAPQQAVDAQLEGVDKVALEIRRGHEALEVLETDPLAAQDVLEGVIILESDQDAAHRHVLENQGQHHSRQNEDQIQLPVAAPYRRPYCAHAGWPRLLPSRIGMLSCRFLLFLYNVTFDFTFALSPEIKSLKTVSNVKSLRSFYTTPYGKSQHYFARPTVYFGEFV